MARWDCCCCPSVVAVSLQAMGRPPVEAEVTETTPEMIVVSHWQAHEISICQKERETTEAEMDKQTQTNKKQWVRIVKRRQIQKIKCVAKARM